MWRRSCVLTTPAPSYTTSVFVEALRLFPVAPFTVREAKEDSTLCGRRIPAKTVVFLNFWYALSAPRGSHCDDVGLTTCVESGLCTRTRTCIQMPRHSTQTDGCQTPPPSFPNASSSTLLSVWGRKAASVRRRLRVLALHAHHVKGVLVVIPGKHFAHMEMQVALARLAQWLAARRGGTGDLHTPLMSLSQQQAHGHCDGAGDPATHSVATITAKPDGGVFIDIRA